MRSSPITTGYRLISWASSGAREYQNDGADVKDAQALLRHSRASTTLDIYQQHVPESQRRVVNQLTERRKLHLVG